MFTRNTLTLGGAAMCGALLLSGCANHMSQRSEHEERIERKLLAHSLQIDVGSPTVLELPQRRVRINEQKTFEVTDRDSGRQIGVFYSDDFARSGKRSGAWMTSYRGRSNIDGNTQNVLASNNNNFIKAPAGEPLLKWPPCRCSTKPALSGTSAGT